RRAPPARSRKSPHSSMPTMRRWAPPIVVDWRDSGWRCRLRNAPLMATGAIWRWSRALQGRLGGHQPERDDLNGNGREAAEPVRSEMGMLTQRDWQPKRSWLGDP